ncbi:UNVERIFIED_CONTAM: hypothetical protein RMT77_006232 [Armadillidium vulgare]
MVLNEDNVGKLEDAARKRKEKLLSLKKKRRDESSADNNEEGNEELPTSQVLFRNYEPVTEKLEEAVLPTVQPGDVEEEVKEQLKHSETVNQITDVEINNLAPKKLTYDLRRGIQSQLDKLDRRTDKSIAELIRMRLKEGKQQDFLMAVNVGARAQQKQSYDSDED